MECDNFVSKTMRFLWCAGKVVDRVSPRDFGFGTPQYRRNLRRFGGGRRVYRACLYYYVIENDFLPIAGLGEFSERKTRRKTTASGTTRDVNDARRRNRNLFLANLRRLRQSYASVYSDNQRPPHTRMAYLNGTRLAKSMENDTEII